MAKKEVGIALDVNDYIIWWITEQDYVIIDEFKKSKALAWPRYLETEYESRRGRPGRGRLWSGVNVDLPDMAVKDDDPVMKQIVAIGAGGIVIRRCHILDVFSFPGFFTTFTAEPFIVGGVSRLQEVKDVTVTETGTF